MFTSLFAAYLAALFLFTNPTTAVNSTELGFAETAAATMQSTWYNTTTGLWNTCGWWNGASNLAALADLAAIDPSYLSTAEGVFNTTFANAPAYNPSPPGSVHGAWLDSCYDDNGWWAMSWIAAYDLTSDASYLSAAVDNFANMSAAWPSACGNGGIPWCAGNTYVNAIANELFLSVAAHLSTRVAAAAQPSPDYLSWAQAQWGWFATSGLIGPNGTVNDGLLGSCANNAATVWSYNQGVIVGALVELNVALPNSSYIDAANAIALAAIAALVDADNVLHDVCEPDACDVNATQFKGIFIRNLLRLHAVSPNDKYAAVIEASALSVWANDRDANGALGMDWSGPVGAVNASTHGSALDALIAGAVVMV